MNKLQNTTGLSKDSWNLYGACLHRITIANGGAIRLKRSKLASQIRMNPQQLNAALDELATSKQLIIEQGKSSFSVTLPPMENIDIVA